MSTSLPVLRRSVVAVSVAGAAALGLGGLLLQPELPGEAAAYVELLAGSPTAALGVQLFAWSQVLWAIGLIGAGHLVAYRAPVLGVLGALLSGLGAFGHAVFSGAMLLQLSLVSDAASAIAAYEASTGPLFIPFLMCGLGGTVLGLVLIAAGLIRGRLAPLWVPIAPMVWVVVEFVLPNFVDWAAYLSVVVGVIAFAGLTVTVWRSGRDVWTTATEASRGQSQPQAPVAVRAMKHTSQTP